MRNFMSAVLSDVNDMTMPECISTGNASLNTHSKLDLAMYMARVIIG